MAPKWYKALDQLRVTADRHALPRFTSTIKRRSAARCTGIPSDSDLLRDLAEAIAYSQGARSSMVGPMLRSREFSQAFSDFDPHVLAKAHASTIIRQHWDTLKVIRFRGKVDAIIGCANVLSKIERESGSFETYLTAFVIPRRLQSRDDIQQFWIGFDGLLSDLRQRKMPFFRSTTSLLQILLDLDYDSVKPDLIIMRLVRRLGIVRKETGDKFLRQAVRLLQEYAVRRGIRVSAVDWYLLAYGGQTEASRSLQHRFCPSAGSCTNKLCMLGRQHRCSDYNPLP